MKRWLLTIAALAALLLNAGVAFAHGDEHDDSKMDHGTPTASPVAMSTSAAYFTITNGGAEDDELIKVETDAAEVVEIHEVVDDNGVKQMRPLSEGLEIDDGETVELKPGGYHLMLIGLQQDLNPGMTFDLTLTFEEAGEVVVPVAVRMVPELPDGATPVPPVSAGDLTITNAWARPAPAMGSNHGMDDHQDAEHTGMATPTASH
jgi:copper(I)-binding protein